LSTTCSTALLKSW